MGERGEIGEVDEEERGDKLTTYADLDYWRT